MKMKYKMLNFTSINLLDLILLFLNLVDGISLRMGF